MCENRTVLEKWHAGLEDKQRRAWNHPRSIWRHSPLGKEAIKAAAAKAARITPDKDHDEEPDEADEKKKKRGASPVQEAIAEEINRLNEAVSRTEDVLMVDINLARSLSRQALQFYRGL
jgi:hypothetical protein